MSWIKPSFGEDGSSAASAAKTSKISNISKTETEIIYQIAISPQSGWKHINRNVLKNNIDRGIIGVATEFGAFQHNI